MTNPILKLVTHFIAPFILLFTLYIQINGEISAGGGFQAGAIFASLLIALDLANGFKFNIGVLINLAAMGVMIYILPGIISLILGQNFLNYNILSSNPITGQKIGIFIIEIGVGMAVSSILCVIYACFWQTSKALSTSSTES